MSLTNKDKIKICKHYDSILNKLKPVSAFMEEPYYPNFINYDYSPTEEEVKHAEHAYSIANTLTGKVSSRSRHDILGFIASPSFTPILEVRTGNYKENTISLEDSILYREVKDNIVIRKKKDSEDYEITRLIIILLSNEIYYLNERTLLVSSKTYDNLRAKLAKKHDTTISSPSLNRLLWAEIVAKEAFEAEISTKKNIHTEEELDYFLSHKYKSTYNRNAWEYRGIIKLDNRKINSKTGETQTLTDSYKLSLK